jgi:hypothetical protein
VIDRLLRIENLWVVGLLLVAVLVALEARWRDDPQRAGVAKAINVAIRVGFGLVVLAIVLFVAAVIFIGPIGNP